MLATEFKPSLHLTLADHWHQLNDMARNGILPAELRNLLIELISQETGAAITSPATPELIHMVKDHLGNGILLSDSYSEHLFDVVVFVPDNGNEEKLRMFFKLIPKYPGGELKYPKYLP